MRLLAAIAGGIFDREVKQLEDRASSFGKLPRVLMILQRNDGALRVAVLIFAILKLAYAEGANNF
jgi:hypothetical protein